MTTWPRKIVDPDGHPCLRCPTTQHSAFIREWVENGDVEGFWFSGLFYFKNRDDYNLAKLLT